MDWRNHPARSLSPSMDAADERIAVLGRGLASLRLSLGEGLLHLDAAGGVKRLGFPTLESYAREALGRTGRWASDVRALARRLTLLPALRAAVHTGQLSVSKAELLARIATPDDEQTWVARARTLNVRQLRAELKTLRLASAEALDADDTPSPRVSLTFTVDRVDAWAFECARVTVESVGARRGDEAVEAMLAEGLGELLARGDHDLPSGIGGPELNDLDDLNSANPQDPQHLGDEALRRELDAAREAAAGIDESLVYMDPIAATPGPELPEIDWPDEAASIDARLRALAATLAHRDLELGALADLIIGDRTWAVLRYLSFDHYCRERIGLSPSGVATRVALARRLRERPRILSALVANELGFEAASLIARVSGPRTEAAWVARARERTVKHLRDEVDAVEMMARAESVPLWDQPPPDALTMADAHTLERRVLAAVCGLDDLDGEGPMSGGDASDCDPQRECPPSQRTHPSLGETIVRLSLTESTATFWHALERLHRASAADHAEPESFLAFLARAVANSWSGVADTRVAYEDVYLRDRWRCASPVCRSRRVTPHHVTFRSHGGGEARTNLIALCPVCHLELVHGGILTVRGLAPARLTWTAPGWSACA